MSYKCDRDYCKKQKFANLNNTFVVPSELDDELRQLLDYFQYRAPGISSAQSFTIPESLHKDIYDKMFENRKYVATEFYKSSKTIIKHMSDNHLNGNSVCVKCKRFVCKLSDGEETKLNCFLRHIRNALAHGRIHLLYEGGYYLCFEDVNKKHNVTARIICNKEDLKIWRKILNQYKK